MFMTFDCLTFEQTHLTREKIVVVVVVVVVVKIKKKTPNFFGGHTPFVCVFLFAVASFIERAASFFLSFLFACERRRKQ